MLIFVESVKKRVYRDICFRLLDIPTKFEININIDKIKLILDDSYFYVLDESKYFLSKFARLISSKGVTHNILLSNQINSYFFDKLFEFNYQKSNLFNNVFIESNNSFLSE